MAKQTSVERMLRAGLALQTATFKFADDQTQVQADARQAIGEMRDAMNEMHAALSEMNIASEYRRHGKVSPV